MRFLQFLAIPLLLSTAALAAPRSALVVIDMQAPFVTRGGNADRAENIRKVEEVNKEQVAAIREAKKAGIPIVFIEYERYGDTNATLRKEVEGYRNTVSMYKNTDGFLSTNNRHRVKLYEYLTKSGIDTIIMTGANGGACVWASIEGALEDCFNVVAYSKAIADFNYEDFIYPYVDQYKDMKPGEKCKDREFREVHNLADVVAQLKRQKPGAAATKSEDSGEQATHGAQ